MWWSWQYVREDEWNSSFPVLLSTLSSLCFSKSKHSTNKITSCVFCPKHDWMLLSTMYQFSSQLILRGKRKLEEAIDNTQPKSSVQKLKDLCCTCWIERIDAIDRFRLSILQLLHVLTVFAHSDQSALLLAISTPDFLSSLVITSPSLKYFSHSTGWSKGHCPSSCWGQPPQDCFMWFARKSRPAPYQVVCRSWDVWDINVLSHHCHVSVAVGTLPSPKLSNWDSR